MTKRERKAGFSRLACLLLALVMLCAFGLTGCLDNGKPTDRVYTEDLRQGKRAYTEIISIEPAYRVGDTYGDSGTVLRYTEVACKCVTTTGETVWVYMEVSDYNDYFDPDADLRSTISFDFVQTLTFAAPVRIDGKAWKADELCEDLSESIGCAMVLKMESLDEATLAAAIPKDQPEEAFTAATKSMMPVYLDIVSIEPMMGITGSFGILNEEVVCWCEMSDGATAWVYMTVDDYNTYFDAEANLTTPINMQGDKMIFVSPVRIHGTARVADDLCEDLSTSLESDMLVYFGSVDPEEVTANLSSNQPEVAYSSTTQNMDRVYADITAIEPVYTITDGMSDANCEVVCTCTTTDSETIWVYITIPEYNSYFDGEAQLTDSENIWAEPLVFVQPVRVHGTARLADDLCQGLHEATGSELVLLFESVG